MGYENISTVPVISKYENNFTRRMFIITMAAIYTRRASERGRRRERENVHVNECEYECQSSMSVFICLYTWDLPYEFDYDSIKSHCMLLFISISPSFCVYQRAREWVKEREPENEELKTTRRVHGNPSWKILHNTNFTYFTNELNQFLRISS